MTTSDTESIVIEVLEDVIGISNLGRDERFFDVGGNSLNLVKVLEKIEERTGVKLAPRLFFDKQDSTAAAISSVIDSRRQPTPSTPSAASHK